MKKPPSTTERFVHLIVNEGVVSVQSLVFYQYLMSAAVLVGIARFSVLPVILRWLVLSLVIACVSDILPDFVNIRINNSNHWWHNIFGVLEYIPKAIIFALAIKIRKWSQIIWWSIPAYLILSMLNFSIFGSFFKLSTLNWRVELILIVLWCYLYFRQLLLIEKEEQLLKDPMLWIATGELFFALGMLAYVNFFDLIVYKNLAFTKPLWRAIAYNLNVLLYSCYLIALLCPVKKPNY